MGQSEPWVGGTELNERCKANITYLDPIRSIGQQTISGSQPKETPSRMLVLPTGPVPVPVRVQNFILLLPIPSGGKSSRYSGFEDRTCMCYLAVCIAAVRIIFKAFGIGTSMISAI